MTDEVTADSGEVSSEVSLDEGGIDIAGDRLVRTTSRGGLGEWTTLPATLVPARAGHASVVVNGRLSASSFRGYRRARPLVAAHRAGGRQCVQRSIVRRHHPLPSLPVPQERVPADREQPASRIASQAERVPARQRVQVGGHRARQWIGDWGDPRSPSETPPRLIARSGRTSPRLIHRLAVKPA